MATVKPDRVRCPDCIREGVARTRRHRQLPSGRAARRCVTHERAKRKADRARSHARHVERTYGITGEEYQALHTFQGGACFVCGRAKGESKRLAVDHEHDRPGCDHPPDTGCVACVRCLACTNCNRWVLGLPVEALRRALVAKLDPPARRFLARRRADTV